MEITLTVRHTEVPERFRRHLEDKLAKVGQVAPRADRLDVVVSHEPNPRQTSVCERVELTLRHQREVVRAEACSDDAYSALDLAEQKLLERVRRLRDRRRVHHGRQTPTSVRLATADLEAETASSAQSRPAPPPSLGPGEEAVPLRTSQGEAGLATDGADGADGRRLADSVGDAPVRIREKTHRAHPMTADEAVAQMEALGHDFYLFICATTGVTSLVYRRRGWSYGVIRLEDADEGVAGASGARATASV